MNKEELLRQVVDEVILVELLDALKGGMKNRSKLHKQIVSILTDKYKDNDDIKGYALYYAGYRVGILYHTMAYSEDDSV